MDESISISKFKDIVGTCLNRVQFSRERILLERHHKDSAALVSIPDYEYLKKINALRLSKINAITESEVKSLLEILNTIGAEDFNEFLSACQFSKVLDELKSSIEFNRKMNKKEVKDISKRKSKNLNMIL
ncbi:MAG: type II toxin-antitoxin system Phd/YefM family antitoxin [Chitinispirillaceae bacterium]|nr:type II toxin-antitoxin system Phd/YefM family antitoxin [Chitinispirillaceae bacterium]